MRLAGLTALFAIVLVLVGICWLIGRCVRWMFRGYWRHE